MGFLEKSVVVKRPIQEVFAAAADFSNSPQIMEPVVAVELLTDGPVRKGYQFKEIREIRGRKVPSIIEVTEFDENVKYAVRSRQQGIELNYFYTFTQTSEGTRIDFNGELITEGIRNKLAKPFLQKIIKKEDQNHLEHLKDYIENGQ
ncbi:SRPBCC family protein [Halobacillus rhizosphaerae]|uniref:SRPBCC family protein n=1 Tax=Halobacillus rhizosphaerae TaxID=3064889 RepID=UPI00398AE63D